jgi:hypothetical protein
MLLRIVEESRELLAIDTTAAALQRTAGAAEAPAAPFSQRVPARGEQVVLTDATTGAQHFYHIVQVQHAMGIDPASGLPTVLGIDVQVRLVTSQSGFNPLTMGAP